MSASPVPPGAPLDVDAVERDLRYVLTVVPASPSVVPDALEDALALCAEVRRLRAALAAVQEKAFLTTATTLDTRRLREIAEIVDAALAPTPDAGGARG